VRSSNGKHGVLLFLRSLAGSLLGCESRWWRFAGSFPASKRSFGCVGSYLRINIKYTRVGTLIVATIYLQLIQNRYMFRSFTVLQ